jgi:hypothetical protein
VWEREITAVVKRTPRPRRATTRKHDLRPLYGSMPGKPNLVAMTITEPDGLLSSDAATREIGRRGNGTLAHPRAEHEWVPPERPTVIVVQSVRSDPLGQMYARRQIDQVRYIAGRGYQELHTITQVGKMRSPDPSMPPIHSGMPDGLVTDRQRVAARRLRGIDQAVMRYLGTLGLYIVRAVLIDRKPLTVAAAPAMLDKRTRGFLFGASLTMIAIRLGLATVSLQSEDDEAKRVLDPRNKP